MDQLDQRQWRRQSRSLFVFQRGLEPAAGGLLLERGPQGFGDFHRGDRGIRLQSRDLGSTAGHEPDLGPISPRRRRIARGRPDACAVPAGAPAARRRGPLRDGMPGAAATVAAFCRVLTPLKPSVIYSIFSSTYNSIHNAIVSYSEAG